MKICSSCGKEINDNAVLCINCGTEVNQNGEDSTDFSKTEKYIRLLFVGLILSAVGFMVSFVKELLMWFFPYTSLAPETYAVINLIIGYVFNAVKIAGIAMSFAGYFGIKKSNIKK